ncbi:MAG: DUF1564 domain-containing protein [Leptospira sp.]|nr:DUF1564 domain-containing protein [Leptospira sp.]
MIEPILMERTQSTLLIPERFIGDFISKTDSSGREMYFHFLLKRYAPLVMAGVFGQRKKVKTCFQEKGNNLIRKNFRPFNPDWIEFGMLADYLGVSRTDLFTMFLKLDISDWPAILRENWYEGGVPPAIANVVAITHIKYAFPPRVFRKLSYRIRR